MLFWHGRPYLIDHGATLAFHHNWATAGTAAARPYDAAQHALLGCAPDLDAADPAPLTAEAVTAAVARVPAEWLADEPGFAGPDAVRAAYVTHLLDRLAAVAAWLPAVRQAAAAGPAAQRATSPARPDWLAR